MGLFDFFRKNDTEKDLKSIKQIMAPFKRTAWIPETQAKAGAVDASKFSGVALLNEGEDWPACGACEQPMQLFLQLDSRSLPSAAEKPFGDGFLQVFYCTNLDPNCEVDCQAWGPFAKSTLVRVLAPDTPVRNDITTSMVMEPFPEHVIENWRAEDDFPDEEVLETLGRPLSEELAYVWLESDYPLLGDKLLGWPHWLQGMEFPTCPDCEQAMHVIFQLDSESANLPYSFGDMGVAHITRCKEHPERLTIQWACT